MAAAMNQLFAHQANNFKGELRSAGGAQLLGATFVTNSGRITRRTKAASYLILSLSITRHEQQFPSTPRTMASGRA